MAFIYCLYVIDNGKRETVLEGETSIWRIRNIAMKRAKNKQHRPGWRIEITRDGKVLRGGKYALDEACYQRWLEEHQEEEL